VTPPGIEPGFTP